MADVPAVTHAEVEATTLASVEEGTDTDVEEIEEPAEEEASDDEGQLYVGTLEAGLYRLDPTTRAARRLDGRLLPSPSVTAIHAITAPAPLFLIGTEAGLLWLDPRRRDDALRGAAEVL